MAKTNALNTVTMIPTSIQQEAGRYLSKRSIEEFLTQAKVKEKDKEQLKEDMLGLAAAKLSHMSSGLAMGKHLASIQSRCTPYKGILPKIMKGFGLNPRQGYRLIASYQNACNSFPESVLKAAMIRGLDFVSYNEKKPLGKYTEIVQHLLPPPRNADHEMANKYIDDLEKTYKEKRKAMKAKGNYTRDTSAEIERDPDFLHRQQFRGIKNALQHIPVRRRQAWWDSLVGMVLSFQGIGNPVSFKPQAIPDEYLQNPGRPSDNKEEAQVA